MGVAAIFGPRSPSLCNTIQSTCNTFEVPNVYMWWNVGFRSYHHSINVYPDTSALSKACLDLLNAKRWEKFTIIYENNDDLIQYQDLLIVPTKYDRKVTLRQLPRGQTYRKLLKEARRNGESNIILDVSVQKLKQVFREAQEVGMLTEYHNYIITSLDFHTLDFKEFHSSRSNITAFRLVDPSRQQVANVIRDWIFGELRYGRPDKSRHVLKTDTALLYDAILLFSQALQDLDQSQPIQIFPIECTRSKVTTYGRSVVSYMKMIHIEGLTGDVKFNDRGQRYDVTLDIVELHKGVVTKVGTWNTLKGVNYTREIYSAFGDITQILRNKTLRHPPFVVKNTNADLKGNDRFQGYCIDLLKEISRVFGFRYEISLVRDNRYGSKNKIGEWNGMIRQLIDREADIAVGDLTITYEREEAVDFTMPFMNVGISILLRHSDNQVPHLFTFLSPLSLEVWVAIGTSYLTVSLVLYVVARFSPYEWIRKRRNDPERVVLENQFNLSASFWFTVGSFTQQSSNLAPRSLSTRILAIIWWFFTLITLSSYTANLAAFLTAQRMSSPILTVEDLEKQSNIRYGCLEGGSTATYFKTSDVPIYKRMWTTMESVQPSLFTKSVEEGIQRVLKENYAFFMESAAIEYVTEKHCNLMQTGGLLDSKGYGIATPSGSPYLQLFSSAILKLQEKGVLHALKEKWWRNKDGRKCSPKSNTPNNTPLELDVGKIGGLFILLLAGVGLACIVFSIEYSCNRRIPPKQQRSLQYTESQL
ncbi:glutamate receptor ionotropic, kainate 2-like [Centruroides vittatus]|uniref:glutamate receptor ionotropic, kainate 2-like n=1 Tax=Centruroides vittatus TaxID=120091 RepID=UPI00351072D8